MKKIKRAKTLRTLDDLAKQGLVDQNSMEPLKKVVQTFSLAISPDMYQLIDKTDPNDPIAKQFVPHVNELVYAANELTDPIGDDVHKKVNGIIHRYPDRCLFTPVHICPVYCRFCFRREKVGKQSETLSPAEMEAAYQYIESHSEIWEVILTGGDPLILNTQMLKKTIERLSMIPHVEIIRIHTRVPVVEPERINAAMLAALVTPKALYILLHSNHPKEFTDAARSACALLVNAGIPLLSQTTLLKGVNDTIDVLGELMRCFVKNRIKPYYLHHADLARGTQHFRTTLEESQALVKQLQGRFSGLCHPTLILDIPGGYGKVPVDPNYVLKTNEGYQLEDYQGCLHHYP